MSASSAALRVLFVDSVAEVGGLGNALLTMLQAMDRSCVNPFYASLNVGQGDMPDRVAALGIPAVRLPVGRFRNLWRTAAKIAALRDIILQQRIEVVLANGGHANLFARPAAWWADRPAAWWVHGWEPTDPLRGHLIAIAHQLIAADVLFANSCWTARVLRLDFPDRPSIRVVRPGVDLRRFHPDPEQRAATRRALGLGDHELVTGMVGRLQTWKGQHIYIQAAVLLAKRGFSCRHLLIGKDMLGIDADYPGRLRRLVDEHRLGDRVLFLGQRDDVNALLNACDVIVHASVEPEPWGLVVAEAMAAGRPVIASAAGGPLEMITHGETGILVPPGDARGLAVEMEQLLRNPDVRHRLSRAARRHADEHLDARQAATHFCTELRRVVCPGATS